jgi:hypothetical protein
MLANDVSLPAALESGVVATSERGEERGGCQYDRSMECQSKVPVQMDVVVQHRHSLCWTTSCFRFGSRDGDTHVPLGCGVVLHNHIHLDGHF